MAIYVSYNRNINVFDWRVLRSHNDDILYMVHKLCFLHEIEKILNPESHLTWRVSNQQLLTWILIFEIVKEKQIPSESVINPLLEYFLQSLVFNTIIFSFVTKECGWQKHICGTKPSILGRIFTNIIYHLQ